MLENFITSKADIISGTKGLNLLIVDYLKDKYKEKTGSKPTSIKVLSIKNINGKDYVEYEPLY